MLAGVFGFHPLAIRDCVARNHVAKVHAYPDHVFVVLHAPERGKSGHVRDRLHSSRASPRPQGAADSHGWQASDTPLPRAPRRVTSCGRRKLPIGKFSEGGGSSWTKIPPSSHCRCTATTFTT